MDKALKIKLSFIMVIFFVFLINYEKVIFIKPIIYSYYSLSSIVISSVSLGIILSVVAYNISIFFYSKQMQYLYYALAQLSVLFFLITLESLYIAPFNLLYALDNFTIHALMHLLVLIFSMLFIREFLNTKEIKKLDIIIQVIIYLSFIDIFITLITGQSIITGLIPIFIPIYLVISESNRLIKNKNIPYYLFYFAWNLVIIIGALVYLRVLNDDFPFLHIAFSIEALLLSLALTYKIKLLQDEKQEAQSLLLQQSRLASMGELIATIAHQWRQPLTHLSFLFMNIKKNSQNPKIIESKLKEANSQLHYMSKTIDDFRNFYNPSKTKEKFDIKTACQNSIKISSLSIELTVKENFTFFGNKNEFEQAVLNIINNAKDAIMHRKIENPKITISIDKPTITITDNAKGVEKKYLDKIFEPYFSTKKDSDGIGLYIAKMIIEKQMSGKLLVKTNDINTTFIIRL